MSPNASPKPGPSQETTDEIVQGDTSDSLSDEYAELNGEEAEESAHADAHSQDEEESVSEEFGEQSRVDVKGKGVARPTESPWDAYPSQSTSVGKKSFWADLDLSIIVAIVSPIGNWLTGGDHIKNLVLVILLIFYLHQLIEGTYITMSAHIQLDGYVGILQCHGSYTNLHCLASLRSRGFPRRTLQTNASPHLLEPL